MSGKPAEQAYRRAIGYLWHRSSYERGFISNPFSTAETGQAGLARMRAVLALLGNPDRDYHIVHIAGSKGKGSTSAMIAAMLRAAGVRTGLFTSPHLHTFRERIAINGAEIDQGAFTSLAEDVLGASLLLERQGAISGTVSTFEFVTVMALLAFSRGGCTHVVLETGMGGEYDATNVVQPAVSVITRIDLEHTAALGDTIAAIAKAKAGIIKPDTPVVVAANPVEARGVFLDRARQTRSPLSMEGRDWRCLGDWRSFDFAFGASRLPGLAVSLPGPHQVENAGAALAALRILDPRRTLVSDEAARRGLAELSWPGRVEVISQIGRPPLVIDGAHTPASMEALRETLASLFPEQRFIAIVGLSSDKPAIDVLAPLAPAIETLIATEANNPRAASRQTVAEAARELGLKTIAAGTIAAALQTASELQLETGSPVIVTGSMYLAGEAREALGLAEPDVPWGPAPEESEAAPVQ